MQEISKRGRPHRISDETRTNLQIRVERAAKRSQRGVNAIQNLDSLPDIARLRLPAVEAATGLSTTTIWRRIKDGKFPALHSDGGTRYYTAAEVRQILVEGAK